MERNHFTQAWEDIFGRKDVVELFRFHPTPVYYYKKNIIFILHYN